MFTTTNIQKMILLIFAIVVFIPVFYVLLHTNIGTTGSFVVYFIYLLIIGYFIRNWGKKKLEK
jgi:hypothetical protein